MYEDKTYQNILEEVLANAPAGVDIRQGSIFYDAVAATCYKIAQYYADLSTSFDLVFLATAVDEYLDQKGAEYGLYRSNATAAKYEYLYSGARPGAGERFFAGGLYFLLRVLSNGVYALEAETLGQASNDILEGTAAIPVNNIGGLLSSTFGKLIEPGVDIESDDDYRQRIREKTAGSAENGNRQHYKTWCEEVAGVGRARIIPLWNGENTVKGVIIGGDGLPATAAVIEQVQEYIDPGGTGLGNGVASIGAHFTAVPATALTVNVTFTADLSSGSTIEMAKAEATAAIITYFRDLTWNTPDSEEIVVRISNVGALLYALPSIIDYADLTFNGMAANIEVENTEVAILGEVVVHEIV